MKLAKAKYWILAATVGVTATTAYWAYGQYKKMLKNIIGFNSITIKNLSLKNIAFDLVVNYTNKMDIDIVLTNQEYDVYLNNIYTTTLKNPNKVVLAANATSKIPLNVSIDPKDIYSKLSINPASFLTDPKKIIVKLDMRLKVKLLFFNINVPYTYQDTLARMTGLK